MRKDFLSLQDIEPEELDALFSLADELKLSTHYRPLDGITAALIFQKPSLRTRASFEIGIRQLGGDAVVLPNESVGIGTRESAADVARLLSRYAQLIIGRMYDHDVLVEIANYSSVPVVNALTDLSHPCQIISDMYTLRQHGKLRPGMKVVFVGDGNNVVNSWLEMAALYPMRFVLAAPEGYGPDPLIMQRAVASGVSTIEIDTDPFTAVRGADAIYTDVWTSMGQEAESEIRRRVFAPYQVNSRMVAHAKSDAVVMHCLPAHRGEEVTAEVLEGPQSIIFDQAENRLHMQKALLTKLVDTWRNEAMQEPYAALRRSS